jgi:hypothetical protein
MKKYEMLFCKKWDEIINKYSLLSKDQQYSEKYNAYKYMLFFDNNYQEYDIRMYKDIKEIINNKGLALLHIRGDRKSVV